MGFRGNQCPETPNDVDELFRYDQSYNIIKSDMAFIAGCFGIHGSRKVQTGLVHPFDIGYGAIRSN